MGTWAVGPYGNDFAQDWAQDLQESKDLYFIEDTLNNVLKAETTEYLEAPFGAEALAAVEAWARLQGKGGAQDEDSAAVDEWVAAVQAKLSKPRADIADKAQRVLALVLSDASELRELWEDSEHFDEWRASVTDLQRRLSA
ncbi:DUF4259 domain-containing protein [Pseudoduganella violaceinigra]|uniref:DUF4259 domain-containing protein n=1 Tax=Pseudoduganella violaceinigra TaxID=246602 RepID=UPI000486F354|nr:DUF4259 domain-containing protein [Pseudoduganella violaceinigra]